MIDYDHFGGLAGLLIDTHFNEYEAYSILCRVMYPSYRLAT
jgi:hypothetical protein